MSDYELHADYDRNGRLTASPAEYGLRSSRPGAIVVANLDVEGRKLPEKVSAGGPVTLDIQQSVRRGGDNELLPLQVRVVKPSVPADSKVCLQVYGELADRMRVFDRSGHPLKPEGSNRYPLDLSAPVLDLFLESQTLPGSLPSGTPVRSSGLFGPEEDIFLDLIAVDPAGKITTLDEGLVRLAPWIIPSNNDKAIRLYICDLAANEPSLRDVQAVLAGVPGVALLTVPEELSPDDAWLQDQFQHGVVLGPAGWSHVILHLPRVRANFTYLTATAPKNLSAFVTSHFPSQDVGLYDELWQRPIEYTAVDGTRHVQSLRVSYQLRLVMMAVVFLRSVIADTRRQLGAKPLEPLDDWMEQRMAVTEEVFDTQEAIAGLNPERRARFEDLSQQLETARQRIDQILPFDTPSRVKLPAPGGTHDEVSRETADRLFRRLEQLHASHNAGGNIEVTPPVEGAPHGKIVIGNHRRQDQDTMDPDITGFLRAQVQPVVQLETEWLKVGHVDEIVTFVPSNRRAGFAIVRASPGVGMAIVRAAQSCYRAGLPGDDPFKNFWEPSGVRPRDTARGTSPVTLMMRGKVWLHQHPPDAPEGNLPPLIYRKLAIAHRKNKYTSYDIHYQHGVGPERRYPAMASIEELLELERDSDGNSVNDFIEARFLSEIEDTLIHELSGAPVVRLPVLFDTIGHLDSWAGKTRDANTCAFTPDMVNLQVVNGHLLIPRPLGPRMRPQEAIRVLREVLADLKLGGLLSRLTVDWLSKRGLDRLKVWMQPEPKTPSRPRPDGSVSKPLFEGYETIHQIARVFKDGFPGDSEEKVGRKILAANPGAFVANYQLRSGWRQLTIPETTVDLFEAYAQLVLEDHGATVHWVDSWYYHVRFGGIHCGTNVLRQPDLRRTRTW